MNPFARDVVRPHYPGEAADVQRPRQPMNPALRGAAYVCKEPSMSFRPSFRLTSLAAGLLLAVTATAQPVFDQPANATFKGGRLAR